MVRDARLVRDLFHIELIQVSLPFGDRNRCAVAVLDKTFISMEHNLISETDSLVYRHEVPSELRDI